MDEAADVLDLQAAADEIGVHYQTAYRWVRNGRLPAVVVDGRYQITRDDLDALDQSRKRPRKPPAPTRKRLDGATGKMHEALVTGNEMAAMQIGRTIVGEGSSIAELIQQVLAPPLRAIGQAWHDGELSVWVEHRASAITERLLADVAPNPRGRRRGTVMVAAVSGDRHSLPTTMAAMTLRDNNWNVHHLGADMPPDDIVGFCAEHEVTLAVLTVTSMDCRALADHTAERLEAQGTPTIVGGAGETLEHLLAQAQAAASATRSS